MRKTRAKWTSSIARNVAFAALVTGCIDATTVYHVPDNGGGPPSGDDDGAAPADDGATGEGSSSDPSSGDGTDAPVLDADAGAED